MLFLEQLIPLSAAPVLIMVDSDLKKLFLITDYI